MKDRVRMVVVYVTIIPVTVFMLFLAVIALPNRDLDA